MDTKDYETIERNLEILRQNPEVLYEPIKSAQQALNYVTEDAISEMIPNDNALNAIADCLNEIIDSTVKDINIKGMKNALISLADSLQMISETLSAHGSVDESTVQQLEPVAEEIVRTLPVEPSKKECFIKRCKNEWYDHPLTILITVIVGIGTLIPAWLSYFASISSESDDNIAVVEQLTAIHNELEKILGQLTDGSVDDGEVSQSDLSSLS